MKLILCVDALTPNLTGIGRYNFELCKRLINNPQIENVSFLRGRRWVSDPNSLLVEAKSKNRKNWLIRRLESQDVKRSLRRDLVHGPNYFLPEGTSIGVVTIHDLSIFRYPETHPPERIAEFERRFTASIDQARHIITDSEFIRQELMAFTGLSPERITAIPLGVSPSFVPRDVTACTMLLDRLGVRYGEYGLCVSSLEPRKRISQLLAAWRMLPQALRRRRPLVLAGGAGWRNEVLHTEIQQGIAEGWLVFAGYVPEEELPVLYAGAALFIYPSIYEGFGLPPIEAMASGVPAIVADQSCLPEVTGGNACMVNPNDVDALAQAIERCMLDDHWRSSAVASGLAWVRQYSWQRCVERTIFVYTQVGRE